MKCQLHTFLNVKHLLKQGRPLAQLGYCKGSVVPECFVYIYFRLVEIYREYFIIACDNKLIPWITNQCSYNGDSEGGFFYY